MNRRRTRRAKFEITAAAANAGHAPRRGAPRSAHEPWTEARVNETYGSALAKIRAVLAEKRASLVPGSALHQYVVELAALSDDDLAAEIGAARSKGYRTPSTPRERVH